ncbi:myosin light chain kinase 2, skeletal/cardiac muscle-like [Chironomus tepperi]|uniref:myosin light chain kinase 2, skeletal/cardiac muscle-like n=1 Tax=Chironomus tepperi TaxID=113505 RepID=UPI00391F819D
MSLILQSEKMIYVDENITPDDDVITPFEYRDVKIKKDENPSDKYTILPELGRGSFGTVFLCKDKQNNMELAVKVVGYKKKKEKIMMETEIDILASLHHPTIICIYDAFDYGNKLYCFMELIQGGELFERVIDEDFILTERACACFIRQICDAIEYMHSKRIIHLDLKPENVLCLSKQGNRIKIIDFGFARRYDPNKNLQVMFGTAEFSAPEVVLFEDIGPFTDMWSIGVICYVLLSGLSPFVGADDYETMTNVSFAKYSFEYASFDQISPVAKDFIEKLLVKESSKRMKAKNALKHEWLIQLDSLPPGVTLSLTKTKLKRYVILRRWRKAALSVMFINKLNKLSNSHLINNY